MSRRKILAVASPIALAMGLSGCAMGGAIPGANTPITQSEEQQGREYHSQILQEFGGAMQGNSANYVRDVGQKIAVQSGLANTPGAFTVSLLNSSVNNAFATTGGYVYTTRQLVTLMNNEAELAGVLGHEVGHVAARHAQRRQQAQQQNTLLGAAGAILSGTASWARRWVGRHCRGLSSSRSASRAIRNAKPTNSALAICRAPVTIRWR